MYQTYTEIAQLVFYVQLAQDNNKNHKHLELLVLCEGVSTFDP